MKREMIENAKEVGARTELLRLAGSKLWDAKMCSEKASYNGYKNALRIIKEARQALDDAEEFIKAAQKGLTP